LSLNNLPEINFVDTDVETMLASMIAEYEAAHLEQTGESKTLQPGDPIRVWIYTQALRYYQALVFIDVSAKRNLLKYADGDFLDHLGSRYGPKGARLAADKAVTTVRYILSAVQASAVTIPAGNRSSLGNGIFFATKAVAEIPAGSLTVDVVAECTEAGAVGNGYTAGQINVLVDPIPYVASVANTDTSQGGSDAESDDAYRERLFYLPATFSVAGPAEAYEQIAKQYSSSIADVKATSPSDGVVDIRFILANGELPGVTLISEVLAYMSEKIRRPLTDTVTGGAPSTVSYDISVTYYIKNSDSDFATNIQTAVSAAVAEYVIWQKNKIGRKINPSELNARIKQAGANRAEITLPIYTAINETALAVADEINIVYGGLEDE
jgi:phage-related baseplate assembly protein